MLVLVLVAFALLISVEEITPAATALFADRVVVVEAEPPSSAFLLTLGDGARTCGGLCPGVRVAAATAEVEVELEVEEGGGGGSSLNSLSLSLSLSRWLELDIYKDTDAACRRGGERPGPGPGAP